MNIDRSEWSTFILGPYTGDVLDATFPCLPQVKTGRVKVLPRPANIGPPDPNVDDTLSNVSWEDLTGGQGISVINPASDMNRFWFGTSDTRYTDGWTLPPEVTSSVPTGTWLACIPLGRIGASIYGLWTETATSWVVHKYDPDADDWTSTGVTITGFIAGEEGIVSFRGFTFIPLGDDGYVTLFEDFPGPPTLMAVPFAGDTSPTGDNDPVPNAVPKPLLFGVHQQKLWAVTTFDEDYQLAVSTSGNEFDWQWPYNTGVPGGTYVQLESGCIPYQLISFPTQTGANGLWVSTNKGLAVYSSNDSTWEESLMWNVPPHPDFGRSAAVFRPGEAIFVASGGGDLMKLTSNGVIVPASGPGGTGAGLPEAYRGSVVSMSTDLANLYVLLSKLDGPGFSHMTLLAGTGIGWHPLWILTHGGTAGAYSALQTGYTTNAAGETVYRLFWSAGDTMYSMPLRLETYSSRQGRESGIDRFSTTSFIELGEFNAGSIGTEKLASHAAVLLDDMPEGCTVSLYYQTEVDAATDWHFLGTATSADAHGRHIFPFGLDDDGDWSSGVPFYWIKPSLVLTGPGGTATPIVRSLTISYLPLPQDAATLTFTVPLPIETEKESDLTAEQIRDRLERYVTSREFLQLVFQDRTYRVYCASVQTASIAPKDANGALSLVVIQINTGDLSLKGEIL